METNVVLREVFCGTELNVVQVGIPEVIPVEACYLGRQESVGMLVEVGGFGDLVTLGSRPSCVTN